MTIKTNNIPAVHYGSQVDHLFVGLDNNAVASRLHVNTWAAGQYVMNFARLDKHGNYLFNIGICTGDYDNVSDSQDIWPEYKNVVVHPVEWFNAMPIHVNKNELPDNTFGRSLAQDKKAIVWDLLMSKINAC